MSLVATLPGLVVIASPLLRRDGRAEMSGVGHG